MGGCCSGIDNLSIQYVRELAVILRTRNLDYVKQFYRKWEAAMEMEPMPDDRQLEIDMHKMICELPALEDLHAESIAFLEANDLAWKIRGNNCSHGCNPGSCGRAPADRASKDESAFQA